MQAIQHSALQAPLQPRHCRSQLATPVWLPCSGLDERQCGCPAVPGGPGGAIPRVEPALPQLVCVEPGGQHSLLKPDALPCVALCTWPGLLTPHRPAAGLPVPTAAGVGHGGAGARRGLRRHQEHAAVPPVPPPAAGPGGLAAGAGAPRPLASMLLPAISLVQNRAQAMLLKIWKGAITG